MKAISTGNKYSIYDDSLRTYDCLPAQVYSLKFAKMSGFYLEKHSDLEIGEEKVYGIHTNKVKKVMTSFMEFTRNLGIILSGDKGIGKSLFARMLASEAVKSNIPVVIVSEYIPGISEFINDIEQEVMFLFDEFDKTFVARDRDDSLDPQTTMLSLFDGTYNGKKLFVITCNELRDLNEFIINRPGRFHYHFRFDYPSGDEIREYLEDKLDSRFYEEINDVIAFSKKININYDCLRSIAFELNHGEKFKDAIKDLNILNISKETYNIKLHYDNGMIGYAYNVRLDVFADADSHQEWCLCDSTYKNFVYVKFNTRDITFDLDRDTNIITADRLHLEYVTIEYEDEDNVAVAERAKQATPLYLEFSKIDKPALHYAI